MVCIGVAWLWSTPGSKAPAVFWLVEGSVGLGFAVWNYVEARRDLAAAYRKGNHTTEMVRTSSVAHVRRTVTRVIAQVVIVGLGVMGLLPPTLVTAKVFAATLLGALFYIPYLFALNGYFDSQVTPDLKAAYERDQAAAKKKARKK